MSGAAAATEIGNAVARLVQLKALEDAWRAENPREGGRHALNGFRFQLLCTLDHLIAQVPGSTASLTAESVADILEGNAETIVVTEVKAGLGSGALSHALGQLWRVHRLAQQAVPDVAADLNYRILYYREYSGDADATLRSWSTGNAAVEDLDAFKQRIIIERKGSVLHDLAGRLVNDFGDDDPYSTIDKWLGKLVGAAATATFAEECERIRGAAVGKWNKAREVSPDFHLWTHEDQPPVKVSREKSRSKQVLTGQRALLRHLKEGRFADRKRYRDIQNKAEEWLSALDRTNRDTLEAMWIAGRSGSGKSVALLHLLAALKATDSQRIVVWLGNQPNRLEEAVKWAIPMLEAGLDVFFGADDPYQSGAGQSATELLDSSLRLLQNRAETAPNLRMPVFFFCGPPEQQASFSDETIEYIRTETYLLPPENNDDITELKDWYFRRTGRAELPIKEEGVLLVQIFFEWQTGRSIGDFAIRLKTRLKRMMGGREDLGSIFDLVSRILAARRLYVPYPKGALDVAFVGNPELQKAFLQLSERDSHFDVEVEREEIRFTHPHLADAIYRAWFGRVTDSPYHGDHLASVIQAWWSFGWDPVSRLKPLWAIESMLAAKDRIGWSLLAPRWELIADVANATLERVFGEQFPDIDEPIAYLPVWARLEARLTLQLQPGALTSLHGALGAHMTECAHDARGMALACRTIIRLAPTESSPVLIPVRKKLNNSSEWRHWLRVGSDYGQFFGFDAIILGARAFIEHNVAEAYSLPRQILFSGLRYPSEAERAFVIYSLRLKATKEPESVWFHAHLISEYLDIFGPDVDIQPLAKRFLNDCSDHSSWSYIWERLWNLDRKSRPAIAVIGFEWLRLSRGNLKGWEFVFEYLVEEARDHHIQPARLLAVGRRWLSRLHGSGWTRVWSMLWMRLGLPSRERMRALGLRWLSRLDDKGWTYVWVPLWADPDKNAEELRELGIRFLAANFGHEGWQSVWAPMWADPGENAEELFVLGLRFLNIAVGQENGEHIPQAWPAVWICLKDWPQCDRDELGRIEAALIAKAPLKTMDGSAGERVTGFSPFQLKDYSWSDGWIERGRVAFSEEEQAKLIDEALDHLGNPRANEGGWSKVWLFLWDSDKLVPIIRDRMAALAFQWLEKTDLEHKTWPSIWSSLWNDARDNVTRDRLVQYGRKFLATGRITEGYFDLWKRLLVHVEDRSELNDLVLSRQEQLGPELEGRIRQVARVKP